ncbi:MAG: hypothetical protein PHO37_05175 [Kiritimatiellae bacterium]|nr:hypothetical protein [Kiritimatiellia bacterium]
MSSREVLVFAFVLPPEVSALPDIGETIAAAMFGDALFKTERFASWVGGSRGRVFKD